MPGVSVTCPATVSSVLAKSIPNGNLSHTCEPERCLRSILYQNFYNTLAKRSIAHLLIYITIHTTKRRYASLRPWQPLGVSARHFSVNVVDADDDLSHLLRQPRAFILVNASNGLKISRPAVQGAFEHPDHEDMATYTGLDWTQPFPGSTIDGFKVHLRS
ncbi:hypothetical protein LY76DRAFT_323238 [Colletotrichum caudatum]|nr:hypothetical protein LY76DRAFT_323238 [Colletotrichum caudatum]